MKSLILAGFMAGAALLPVPASAQSDSAGASSGLSIATGAQRAAGATMQSMRGRPGWSGGTRNWQGGGNWRGNTNWRGNGNWQRPGNWRGGQWQGGGNWHRGGTRFSRGSRFFVGGFLPRFFLAPQYYVTNYPVYGLAQPGAGYRWVRYYDDAYLVDGRGYISDYRSGVPYDGGGYDSGGGYGYDDGYGDNENYSRDDDGYYRRDDRNDRDDRYSRNEGYYCDAGDRRGGAGGAVVGAVAGGVLGGVAGNLIAGRGDRTEGTIIGAGLGAVAGGAVGAAAGQDRRRAEDCYPEQRGYRREAREEYRDGHDRQQGDVPAYVGGGDYYPPPGGPDYDYRSAGVSYGQRYDFDHAPDARHEQGYATYGRERPVYQPPIRTEVHVGGGAPVVRTYSGGGGISQNATTTIVLNSVPATTTTTTYIEEEVEYVAPRRGTHSKRLRR